jgi:thiamine biosynthesis lipoprotein
MLALAGCAGTGRPQTAATVAMDTVVEQNAYGPAAQAAMREVNARLAAWDEAVSLYAQDGDVARINAGAGSRVDVAPATAGLLRRAQALSAQSEGAFAFTIAPVTLAWGVTGDDPRVPSDAELEALLPLVDDAAVEVGADWVRLPRAGMGIDLGGIAKGAACDMAAEIYEAHGVDRAWLWIGGNIYARGRKPDGRRFSFGFADPTRRQTYIASFEMEDAVVAVSGGYERWFEADGTRYIHIFDPRTGRPATSDIVSVGVVCKNGAEADFWSTTLFVWGRERTLRQMRAGLTAIVLDDSGTLYVSDALRDGFALQSEGYTLEYVPADAG